MDKNMANRMCCDLDIRDYSTKAPIMRVDFCNTTTYGFNSDAVFANRKGAKAIKFESPLKGNIDITFQVHPFKVYSLLNGGQVLTDALLVRRENITASVDGKSGSWSESSFHFYAPYVGGNRKTIYVVWYGSQTLVISPSEELVFFGTEKQASENERNNSRWKNCEKKRL